MADTYGKKKDLEKEWYEKQQNPITGLVKKLMHSPLFFSRERNRFNYRTARTQMSRLVRDRLGPRKVKRLLIAPCGTGTDIEYLAGFAEELYGIDLSPIAVDKCPTAIRAKVGDILKTGYPDGWFDLVASPLFFHHMVEYGFDGFLNEIHRILAPGGGFISLEPSVWYPVNMITRPLKHLLGNPFDEVEDEGPFRPSLMLNALRNAGFTQVHYEAATFSHCSFYVPVAKAVNWITRPFLRAVPFRQFGWMLLYWACKKPA